MLSGCHYCPLSWAKHSSCSDGARGPLNTPIQTVPSPASSICPLTPVLQILLTTSSQIRCWKPALGRHLPIMSPHTVSSPEEAAAYGL